MSRGPYGELLSKAWQDHRAARKPDAPTVISTFAGAGGSSLGYSMAGYRELLAVEFDKHAVQTLRQNFTRVPLWANDIAWLSVEKALEISGLEPGELDVLDGSPPCQGFSPSGNRRSDDPRNQLFREYVRLAEGLRPKVLVMENVSGMIHGPMKPIFAEIIEAMEGAGYTVEARLLNSTYFYVPQNRVRLIFIGVRNDLGIAPSHPIPRSRKITVREALIGVEAKTLRRVTPSAGLVWDQIMPGQYGDKAFIGEGRKFFNLVKVDPAKPAPTICKNVGGVGGLWHWSIRRRLSVEELKRLSSFPDQFVMEGTYTKQVERLGNSVPPLMMYAIADHVRREILAQTKGPRQCPDPHAPTSRRTD